MHTYNLCIRPKSDLSFLVSLFTGILPDIAQGHYLPNGLSGGT